MNESGSLIGLLACSGNVSGSNPLILSAVTLLTCGLLIHHLLQLSQIGESGSNTKIKQCSFMRRGS